MATSEQELRSTLRDLLLQGQHLLRESATTTPARIHSSLIEYAADRERMSVPAEAFGMAEELLLRHLRSARAALADERLAHQSAEATGGESLVLDQRAADFLQSIGPRGADAAATLRTKSGERWSRLCGADPCTAEELARVWFDESSSPTPSRFMQVLARVVVVDILSPALLEGARRAPAIYSSVHRARGELRHGPALEVPPESGGGVLRAANGVVVAELTIDGRSDLARLRTAAEEAVGGGLAFEKIWRLLPRAVFEQAARNINPATRLVFDGIQGLCSAAGISSGRDLDAAHNTLELLQAWRGARRDLPPALMYWHQPAVGRQRASLRIDVGEALAPGHWIGTSAPHSPQRQDRFLLPVLPLPDLTWAGPRQHSRLAALQWELLYALRDRVECYPDGVQLAYGEVCRAADKAGVTAELATEAIAHWGADGWLRPHGGGFQLADVAAHQLFLRAAELVRSGRDAGRRRSTKKSLD